MAALKFKPYVPLPQRQRKKKHPDLAPKERRHDATLLETCGEDHYSQHNAEGLSKMNDQEVVMALDWSGHDWSDDMQFVSHPMNRCYASNAGGEEVDEHLGSSIVRVEDIQKGDSKATEKSPTLMDPAAPAAVMVPPADVADDNLIQTALTWPKAGTAKQSADLSRLGIDQLRGPHSSPLSSPGSSASAPAPANAESLSLKSLLDDDAGFQHWLNEGQQHVIAPISNRTKRLLGDNHHGSGVDDQQETKRLKLPSAAERRTLLHQPGVYDSALIPVDDGIDFQDQDLNYWRLVASMAVTISMTIDRL
ncbi:hypothetical protein HRG_014319 [Hirsutella rhossiliensis]